MAKNGMKVNGVLIMIIIMIMLSFSEANYNYNPVYEEIRANDVPEKLSLSCKVKCDLICAPVLLLPGRGPYAYTLCVNACQTKCPNSLDDDFVDFCVTGCVTSKYLLIKPDVPGAAAKLVNSCVQECS